MVLHFFGARFFLLSAPTARSPLGHFVSASTSYLLGGVDVENPTVNDAISLTWSCLLPYITMDVPHRALHACIAGVAHPPSSVGPSLGTSYEPTPHVFSPSSILVNTVKVFLFSVCFRLF